ncbi:hypothetical protein [Terribacillus sp. AE2B 122]|uniref:hypothetical protein n=1 Tax=Terribacillus sp. AE2B 122 TaxID=1331902 RepID=UPI001440BF05|nr:hypothetical protein [Terribacillus sp. AE2B 122]VVM34041.1 hypothetical protein [Terribacillus sp. AE2B 122]
MITDYLSETILISMLDRDYHIGILTNYDEVSQMITLSVDQKEKLLNTRFIKSIELHD